MRNYIYKRARPTRLLDRGPLHGARPILAIRLGALPLASAVTVASATSSVAAEPAAVQFRGIEEGVCTSG